MSYAYSHPDPHVEGPMHRVPEEGMRKIWGWAVLIAVGGFLFGFDTGVVSGALLFIKPEFHLNALEQGSVVSVLLLGAMAGALTAGRVADRLGRKMTFGLEGVVFLVGTAMAVFATGYPMLLVARVVLGLAVGAASAIVPVYLSEISPPSIRGRTLTLNQLLITVGILVAYGVNLTFAGAENWRAMFACGAVPALLMVVAALWMLPESPSWLASRGRTREARKVIASVTDDETAELLLERWNRREEEDEKSRPKQSGWHLLKTVDLRPALVVGLTLAAVQQFGGINTIIYYAPTLMQSTGLNASNSIFYSIAIGVINLVMTVVSIRLVDRAGRRPLLLGSLAGMAITLGLLGLAFVLDLPSWLALVAMVLYIAAFAAGMGPTFWVIIGEIFPPRARAAGSSASTTVNWMSNFIVSLVFLTVVNAIGEGQTFWIFALVCVFAVWFVMKYVPETKNRDVDKIDADMQVRFGRRPASGEAARRG
ncbi:sugar porter family MFS transporter [Thermomonospora umbrina]|uniref:Sugar porter (SP) family MFS transporter n=1 Tax=Thermomonospora umbrina TaxID=111806 RepID=A0A3D9SZ55_9ACTN|nr:sugar porter family MFS transporter [Thermomonospora umbrina]REE98255.1 sugar porter (SP) family MFS transporter [Thermomonospora umbrina]